VVEELEILSFLKPHEVSNFPLKWVYGFALAMLGERDFE